MKNILYPMLAVAAIAIGAMLYNATSYKTITPVPAPEVTFASIQGEQITTQALRGKVVLVNFWATDCAVCLKEMPQLIDLYNKFKPRGFEVMAVAMRHDPPNYVLAYAEKNALPFKVVFDPIGAHALAFGEVKLTPTTFIIDKRSQIVARIQGEPDFAQLGALIEAKLGEAL